nr:hypothetical protein [Armatimonas sp.]
MLPILWGDVPGDYRDKPVYTDKWGAYERFFPSWQHHSEGWNTKWRQRQSGLVRESCGVHHGDVGYASRELLEQQIETHSHRTRHSHFAGAHSLPDSHPERSLVALQEALAGGVVS